MGIPSDRSSLQNQLPISVNFPEEIDDLRERIDQTYQDIAIAVNSKIGGLYVPQEKITFEQYYDTANPQKFRNVYRMVVDVGALPNAGTSSTAHGITFTSSSYVTHVYGAASDTSGMMYIPLPFASPTDNLNISLEVTSTDVIITTDSDYSAYTTCYVVIQYVKG